MSQIPQLMNGNRLQHDSISEKQWISRSLASYATLSSDFIQDVGETLVCLGSIAKLELVPHNVQETSLMLLMVFFGCFTPLMQKNSVACSVLVEPMLFLV